MGHEIEAKYLNVDVDVIEERLRRIGAHKVYERVYKVKVYDFPNLWLNSIGAWARVRDEGDRVVMTYKRRLGMGEGAKQGDTGMEEIELQVDSFETASFFLEHLGMVMKFYEEKWRIRWARDGVEFDIDRMPGLNPYLEIEGSSWMEIDQAAVELELNPDEKKICSAFQIYEEAGINMNEYEEISFTRMTKKSH
jgi:adenylate cyclase, class 2